MMRLGFFRPASFLVMRCVFLLCLLGSLPVAQAQELTTSHPDPISSEPVRTATTTPPPIDLHQLGTFLLEGTHQKKSAQASPRSTASSSSSDEAKTEGTAQALRIVIGLTLLALLPAMLVCLTSFLRIIIVLSMLRHAIGMQETPPNTVLIGLGLFLTIFTMSPILEKMNQAAIQPFMAGKLSMQAAYDKGIDPLREFMVRQTREQDLILLIELSKAKIPENMADISNIQLIPAFMLSELRAAFQIGFVIFLPFLLIDLIVSSLLMALGMMMMPPTTIALPLKILMFILIDGWSLILKALVGSFH